jgi:hypothetical protein
MWECRKCHEQHEDSFQVCWNCGTSKDGVEDPSFVKEDQGDRPLEAGADESENTQAITAARPRPHTHPHVPRAPARMTQQLVFVGLNGYALALDRDTGEIVWSNSDMKSGYVTLLLDGDRLIVSTNGYIYCLDPLTGRTLWHNPLSGYGVGAPTSLTSVRGLSAAGLIQQQAAEQIARSSD